MLGMSARARIAWIHGGRSTGTRVAMRTAALQSAQHSSSRQEGINRSQDACRCGDRETRAPAAAPSGLPGAPACGSIGLRPQTALGKAAAGTGTPCTPPPAAAPLPPPACGAQRVGHSNAVGCRPHILPCTRHPLQVGNPLKQSPKPKDGASNDPREHLGAAGERCGAARHPALAPLRACTPRPAPDPRLTRSLPMAAGQLLLPPVGHVWRVSCAVGAPGGRSRRRPCRRAGPVSSLLPCSACGSTA